MEHVGIYEDFEAGYRTRNEYEEWYERDCVALQRKRLIQKGFSEADIQQTEAGIDDQIRISIQEARDAPFPQPQELYRGVFHETD